MGKRVRQPPSLQELREQLMALRSARRDAADAVRVMGDTHRYLEGAKAVQSGGGQVALVVTTAIAEQLCRAFGAADYSVSRVRDELDDRIRQVEAAIDHVAGKPEIAPASSLAQAMAHSRDFGFLEVGDSPRPGERP